MIKKRVRLIAVLMVLLTVLYALCACTAPDPDAYPDEDGRDTDGELNIQNGGKQDIIFDYIHQSFRDANAELVNKTETDSVYISDRVTYDGYDEWERASICAKGKTSFELKEPLINDWSDYDALSVAVYSDKATDTTVMLCFSSPNVNNTAIDPYICFTISVSFTGWKVFNFSISEAFSEYSPDISNIVKCNYVTSGWDLTCSSENVLYFGYMYLYKEAV